VTFVVVVSILCMLCRFSEPLETSASCTDSQPLRDFEFARQELAAKQNARCIHLLSAC